jgi:hypothetical protein
MKLPALVSPLTGKPVKHPIDDEGLAAKLADGRDFLAETAQ